MLTSSMNEDLIIYTHASKQFGYGHLHRSFALAEQARKQGIRATVAPVDVETTHIMSAFGIALPDPFASETVAYIIRDVPVGSPLEVVEKDMAEGKVVLLMDDSGPARTKANIVSDAMMTSDRIAALAHSDNVRYLYGFDYCVLKSDVLNYQAKASPGLGKYTTIVFALGGGFSEDYLSSFLGALNKIQFDGKIEILLTDPSQKTAALQQYAGNLQATIHVGISEVGRVLSSADIVVTKIGVSMLEAFAVGLGCFLIEPTDAHHLVGVSLMKAYDNWPAIETGIYTSSSVDELATQLIALVQNRTQLTSFGSAATTLVDGSGGERLINALLET
ncbi:MAG: hypothetical protein OEZ43_07995 [Gammaproteobacteria bacterium]|nr:hypothetical protein [Gammaproteobacteria bacterium]